MKAKHTQKRYAVTIDFFAWADSDLEIIKKANEITQQMRADQDNHAKVLEIISTPFASLDIKKVDLNLPYKGNK